MSQPIRVFVGTSPADDIEAERTLRYSIEKHTSRPVEFTWMHSEHPPYWSGWDQSSWATPFSGYRWSVPEAAGFTGRAIYIDVDMLCLADLAELYDREIPDGKCVLGRGDWRLCVSLWDCERTRKLGWIPPIAQLKRKAGWHRTLNRSAPPFQATMGAEWNCTDGRGLTSENREFAIEEIKILHFTERRSQPWRPAWAARRLQFQDHRRPDLVQLWQKYHEEALKAVPNPRAA